MSFTFSIIVRSSSDGIVVKDATPTPFLISDREGGSSMLLGLGLLLPIPASCDVTILPSCGSLFRPNTWLQRRRRAYSSDEVVMFPFYFKWKVLML